MDLCNCMRGLDVVSVLTRTRAGELYYTTTTEMGCIEQKRIAEPGRAPGILAAGGTAAPPSLKCPISHTSDSGGLGPAIANKQAYVRPYAWPSGSCNYPRPRAGSPGLGHHAAGQGHTLEMRASDGAMGNALLCSSDSPAGIIRRRHNELILDCTS